MTGLRSTGARELTYKLMYIAGASQVQPMPPAPLATGVMATPPGNWHDSHTPWQLA